ncbi:MAG: hypothetical protein HKN68_11940 [Saprospiraceae bacterium]|nr:hypothetical protein [Saprospiraceae bacterium]
MLDYTLRILLTFFIIAIAASPMKCQGKLDLMDRFSYFLGQWEHNSTSDTISHTYKKVLSDQFIKMNTSAFFYGDDDGINTHTDEGYISYDQDRRKYVFRQFHSEGFINTYVLDEDKSTPVFYVWNSEHVENGFGLKAMLTIEIKNDDEYSMILHLGKEGESITACQWINAKRIKS